MNCPGSRTVVPLARTGGPGLSDGVDLQSGGPGWDHVLLSAAAVRWAGENLSELTRGHGSRRLDTDIEHADPEGGQQRNHQEHAGGGADR
jgi:hypothetical protein